jgi:hypothetical protein
MIRALLGDPRFWALLGLGTLVSLAFTGLLLRQRSAPPAGSRQPALVVLGAGWFVLLAAGFVLFRWGGCVTALALSLLGWLTVPLAGAIARQRPPAG